MSWIDDLKIDPATREAMKSLTRVAPDKLEEFASECPGLPVAYLQFLRDAGWGSIGRDMYSIYGGPVEPGEIWDEEAPTEFGRLPIFGDNFAGICFALAKARDWTVAEIGPFVAEVEFTGRTFEDYVSELIRRAAE
jgi:hypothetical protein